MQKILSIVFIMFIMMVVCQSVRAEDNWREENAQLRQRIEKLEAELQKLTRAAPEQSSAAQQHLQQENAELAKRLEKVEAELEKFHQTTLETQFKVKLYGYVKLDIIYDSARTNAGNVAMWVESEEQSEDDDDFHITVNQSRLGLELQAPEYSGICTIGKVELDFYGGGPENKSRPMLRQAYLQAEWPAFDFSILAGQAWDVISPLSPDTLNFLVQSCAGNMSYRRPQLRLNKGFALTQRIRLLVQGAVARTIGHAPLLYPTYLDSGSDFGFGTFQGRIALSFPLLASKLTVLGFSGHWGREEYDTDNRDNHELFDSWSFGCDLTFPLTDKIVFKGELWLGKNLDTYLAGINQGVNTVKLKEISSRGGWFSLSFGPWGDWRFNAGAGIEDPRDNNLNRNDRKQNLNIYGNVWYNITEFFQTGLEVGYWKTLYKGLECGDSIRIHTALMLQF